ncbi:MAG TPA: SAM-dependent methyltransferase [Beijerinckiaceae bacterium]|nr:SAM-dependent methyltransferase [Beijerinckiaceae bacterium]
MTDVPRLFDRALVRRHQGRALAALPATFLLDRAAEDLGDRLQTVTRGFSRIVDLGTPGAGAADVLAARFAGATVTRIGDVVALRPDRLVEDLEAPALGQECADCVVSLLALQTVNDLPGLLMQIRRALVADGLFIAALAGGDTLKELRACLLEAEVEETGGAAPRIFPFADVRTLGQLLQRAGFALPVVDSETLVVRYGDPLRLLADLRAMGAANALADRSRRPLRRAVLMRALELYRARFADADGRVRATFEIVWLSGWAPHESQQKPLKPGSARVRLADALRQPDYAKPATKSEAP